MFVLRCGLLSYEIFSNMYKMIKCGSEWHAELYKTDITTKNTFFLCFSLCMYISFIMTAVETVLTVVGFEFVNILCFKWSVFFSIYSELHFENWLLCCDLGGADMRGFANLLFLTLVLLKGGGRCGGGSWDFSCRPKIKKKMTKANVLTLSEP